MIDKLYRFFQEGLWTLPYNPQKKIHSFFLRLLRVGAATLRGISKDECFLKASALTYYSLLSIIPLLAVAFGIAKGFGFEHTLEAEIIAYWREQPEMANKILQFTYSLLEETRGNFIAGIGLATLLWTVLRLLETIEYTLNNIWKVSTSRTLGRKLSDYTTTILLCPIFIAISSSLTVYVSTTIHEASQTSKIVDSLYPVLLLFYHLLPLFMAWLLFTFIYGFLPNASVSRRAFMTAGIVAGTFYYVLQWVYIHFQIGVSSYSAIYGSFAAIPLFLIWLNMSWVILLSGAEMAYHIQENEEWILLSNQNIGDGEIKTLRASRQLVALLIVHHCIYNFKTGNPPVVVTQLSKEIGVGTKMIEEILKALIDGNILSEARGKNREKAYLPARSVNTIYMKAICDALDLNQLEYFSMTASPTSLAMLEMLTAYHKQGALDSSNVAIA